MIPLLRIYVDWRADEVAVFWKTSRPIPIAITRETKVGRTLVSGDFKMRGRIRNRRYIWAIRVTNITRSMRVPHFI